jgi:hypothetical protein
MVNPATASMGRIFLALMSILLHLNNTSRSTADTYLNTALGMGVVLPRFCYSGPAAPASLPPIVDEAMHFRDAPLAKAEPLSDHRQRRLLGRTGIIARIIAVALEDNSEFFQTRTRTNQTTADVV